MTAAAARAQEILKCDHIRFAIHPIDSYIALRDNFKELLESQPEVRAPSIAASAAAASRALSPCDTAASAPARL